MCMHFPASLVFLNPLHPHPPNPAAKGGLLRSAVATCGRGVGSLPLPLSRARGFIASMLAWLQRVCPCLQIGGLSSIAATDRPPLSNSVFRTALGTTPTIPIMPLSS